MDLGIAGKNAVVTASSSGLGKAIAETLAAEGVNLVLMARSADKLENLCGELADKHGIQAVSVVGDMCRKQDVLKLAGVASGQSSGPDILILNSGRPPSPMREVLDETDDERWQEAYETQLWGSIMVAREIVPMIVAKGWGRVVGVTSASVKQPMIKHGLSTVFRAGITGYLKHLSNEIAHTGVTVNTVCPASIETDALRNSYDIDKRAATLPLKRIGRPEELAGTVAFFTSQQAGFITGASMQVDGGQNASII